MSKFKSVISAAFAGLAANKKEILEQTCAAYAAIGAINFDMSGYTSRFEASQMLNVNWTTYKEGIKLLATKEVAPDFVGP